MKIDIRNTTVAKVTEIEFAEKRAMWKTATKLTKGTKGITIESANSGNCVVVHSVEDLENLIKALEKAKELKWTVEDVV